MGNGMHRGSQQQQPQRGQEGRQAAPAGTPVDRLKGLLWDKKRELVRLFPEQGDAIVDRLIVVAANGFRRLLEGQRSDATAIDPWSVAQCVIQAAQLGLEAGTDEAYLVPYKGIVQLIIGPRGLVNIAYRSERIAAIEYEVVREHDHFDYILGDAGYIKHRKATRAINFEPPQGSKLADLVGIVRGELSHAWAVVKIRGGEPIRKVMTAEDVARHRSFSKASSGPWFDNTEGMWAKTVLKQALKTAPRSPILTIAMQEDEHGAFIMPQRGEMPALDEPRRAGAIVDAAPVGSADEEAARRIDQGQDQTTRQPGDDG